MTMYSGARVTEVGEGGDRVSDGGRQRCGTTSKTTGEHQIPRAEQLGDGAGRGAALRATAVHGVGRTGSVGKR